MSEDNDKKPTKQFILITKGKPLIPRAAKKDDEPGERIVPPEEPSITTMGDGEPEKRFGRPPVIRPEDEEPGERPVPDDEPGVTTMGGGEPEKQFTPR